MFRLSSQYYIEHILIRCSHHLGRFLATFHKGGIMESLRPPFTFNLGRRAWLRQSSIVAGSFAIYSSRAVAASDNGISRTAESIHQEVLFNAAPNRVYDALTDASQFQRVQSFSASMKSVDVSPHPVVISREAGGAFSLFGDYIIGRQIELVTNRRIVQAWRVAAWSPGIFSVARFELEEQGPSTKLVFDHIGFPAGTAEHLAAGWRGNYWEPLERFLA
jgi:activator of HSP90 ATPase